MSDSGKKPVGILFSRSPFSDYRVSESLRMAVGLTLGKNSVRLFFSGDGVFCLLKNDAERLESLPLAKHIETLGMLKCPVIAEEESLEKRDISPELIPYQLTTMKDDSFLEQLNACEILIHA